MIMGGLNSPAELQTRMDQIFGLYSTYIDDFMWSCDTVKESIDIFVDMIMKKCVQFNFKLNFDKIYLVQKSLVNLGKLVDNDKIFLNDETVSKILSAKLPKTPKTLQSYLGLINWGRDHLHDLKSNPVNFVSYVTKVLTPMINESQRLKWNPEREAAFDLLKYQAAHQTPLHFFDPDEKVNLACDASGQGWGAIIFHINPDGSKRIFGIASGSFGEDKKEWSINDKEAYAILAGTKAFKNYLFGRHFNLFTDHKNLSFIHSASTTRIARWRFELGRFYFTVYHIPGHLNWETDFLSRMEVDRQQQFTSFKDNAAQVSWGSVSS